MLLWNLSIRSSHGTVELPFISEKTWNILLIIVMQKCLIVDEEFCGPIEKIVDKLLLEQIVIVSVEGMKRL